MAIVYSMLFEAAAETLKIMAADPRHLGAEIGAIMVLLTWGRTLPHPHVHCIVPADEFLRRFLLRVLSYGFSRIRH
jgi:hypothetical protein